MLLEFISVKCWLIDLTSCLRSSSLTHRKFPCVVVKLLTVDALQSMLENHSLSLVHVGGHKVLVGFGTVLGCSMLKSYGCL